MDQALRLLIKKTIEVGDFLVGTAAKKIVKLHQVTKDAETKKTKRYVKFLGGTLWLGGTGFICFHYIGRRNSERRTKEGHTTNNRVWSESGWECCNFGPRWDDDMTMLDFTPAAWGKNRNDRGKFTFCCMCKCRSLQCKATFKKLFVCPQLTRPLFFGHEGRKMNVRKLKTK